MASASETGRNFAALDTKTDWVIAPDITMEDVENLVPDARNLIRAKFDELGIAVGEPLALSNPLIKHVRQGRVSGAQYLYEQDHGNDAVLVSFSNTQEPTIPHQHLHPDGVTDVTEEYYWLGGDATLNLNGVEVKLNQENPFVAVLPGVVHYLTTESFALSVIIMRNVAPLASYERHLSSVE